MHANSDLLFKKYCKKYFNEGLKVLEIGPDTKSPFGLKEKLGFINNWDLLDITDKPYLTYPNQPLYNYTIENEAYDLIFSNMVMEHVIKVWDWLRELERILKDNGVIIILSPISEEHHGEIDCWRIYPDGMRALVNDFTEKLEIELCIFESLEMGANYKNRIPGRSHSLQQKWLRRIYWRIGKFGYPVEARFDMVTILRKKSR